MYEWCLMATTIWDSLQLFFRTAALLELYRWVPVPASQKPMDRDINIRVNHFLTQFKILICWQKKIIQHLMGKRFMGAICSRHAYYLLDLWHYAGIRIGCFVSSILNKRITLFVIYHEAWKRCRFHRLDLFPFCSAIAHPYGTACRLSSV